MLVPVYDILNCGPRNRFVANGKLVHNSMGLNQENLPRILPGSPKPTDALRLSLRAPKGYQVVVADLSQIELRVNMFLWQVPYAMKLFQDDPGGADPYKELASEVMGVPKDGMPKMVRQGGKAMHLGCGFGLRSERKYVAVARSMAQIEVSLEDATKHIAGYRTKHPEVVQGWRKCHEALPAIRQGAKYVIDPWGLCYTSMEGIHTPTGMIRYPSLEQVEADGRTEWWYGLGRNKTRIYAGKVTENIVQHLARNILAGYMLQVKKQLGRYPVHCVHDELVYIVPEAAAVSFLVAVQQIMHTPPPWWPELVTWSEGAIGDSYGDCK